MTSLLDGKIYVVTGGFGALGSVLGEQLARHGARVALVGRGAAPGVARAGVLEFGGVDLAGEKPAEVFNDVTRQLGGLDGLVNVAGAFRWEKIDGGAVETWDAMYTTNLRTALQASMAALPHLVARGAGRIVNIGAAAAEHASLGMGAYAASKAGVARLTEAMAEEFKDRGIRVNAVLPGMIDTPANRRDMPDADFSRWVAPASLAQVVAFLLSDAAADVNGALIPVKGRG